MSATESDPGIHCCPSHSGMRQSLKDLDSRTGEAVERLTDEIHDLSQRLDQGLGAVHAKLTAIEVKMAGQPSAEAWREPVKELKDELKTVKANQWKVRVMWAAACLIGTLAGTALIGAIIALVIKSPKG